jgi:hypothetical protein
MAKPLFNIVVKGSSKEKWAVDVLHEPNLTPRKSFSLEYSKFSEISSNRDTTSKYCLE